MGRNNILLYFLVLVMMIATSVAALGGGLFAQTEFWFLQWQHQAFAQLCHQMPDRSFWLGGQPMAVCSRCLGVYFGFLTVWLSAPLIQYYKNHLSVVDKRVLLAVIAINVLDVLGNLTGFWQNTLVSRLVLGGLIGSSVAAFISGYLLTTIKKREKYYGTITTTNTR